jgi:hypothetical protein
MSGGETRAGDELWGGVGLFFGCSVDLTTMATLPAAPIATLLTFWILQQEVSPMEWLAMLLICRAVAFEALWPRPTERFAEKEA